MAISGAVLIVDDEPDDILFTRRSLSKLKLRNSLQVVKSGKELISYLEGVAPYQDRARFPYPAVILLDVKMPEMDGLQVLEWLRQQPRHSAIPVVMLSGWGKELRQMQRAYELGAKSFLTKPFVVEDFASTVTSLQIPLQY